VPVPRQLGIQVDGRLPPMCWCRIPRYLIDHSGISAGLAGATCARGLTRLIRRSSALPRMPNAVRPAVGSAASDDGIVVCARAVSAAAIVADIDPARSARAALRAGPLPPTNGDPNARKALSRRQAAFCAVDFVGSDGSLAFAAGSLPRGGKVVITGLLGAPNTKPIRCFRSGSSRSKDHDRTLDEANERWRWRVRGKNLACRS